MNIHANALLRIRLVLTTLLRDCPIYARVGYFDLDYGYPQTALWIYRVQAIEYLPPRLAARFREYQPLQTFANAAGSGFNTTSFSLDDNLEEGESRSGLDEAGLTEVRRIMDGHRVGFDEARLIRQQRIMRKNGIDPATGLPLDSKAITSLS